MTLYLPLLLLGQPIGKSYSRCLSLLSLGLTPVLTVAGWLLLLSAVIPTPPPHHYQQQQQINRRDPLADVCRLSNECNDITRRTGLIHSPQQDNSSPALNNCFLYLGCFNLNYYRGIILIENTSLQQNKMF